MLCAQTKNGSYLVQVNPAYACYADKDGNLIRSVDNVPKEIDWAKTNWKNYEEIDFPEELEQQLLKCLQYISEYKDSLVEE